jgi:sigma-B regulation protein RsbU (phosphoserine phosphatase)
MKHISRFSLLAVVASIIAIAYADSVVTTISLGFLYLFPLTLSALLLSRRVTLVLVFCCVFLHDWFGPYEYTWGQVVSRNVISLAGFGVVAMLVSRLAEQQRRLTALVRQQRDELAHEIEIAAQVQRRMLPSVMPQYSDLDLAARMRPAKVVAGDFYDVIEMGEARLGLAVADVAGKGVPAGILVPTLKAALRLEAPRSPRSDLVAASLNDLIFDLTDDVRYVTFFYATFDTESRTLQYTNAGHLAGLLFRSSTGRVVRLEQGGLPLGLFRVVTYQNETVQLEREDVLVLYSDGIVEAEDEAGEPYSLERLERNIVSYSRSGARALLDQVLADVAALSQDEHPADDQTMLVLRIV